MIRISLKFVPRSQVHKSALVHVMAWHRAGDKPLPEPMLTQFTGAYMRHLREMSEKKKQNIRFLINWTIMRKEQNCRNPGFDEIVSTKDIYFLITNTSIVTLFYSMKKQIYPGPPAKIIRVLSNFIVIQQVGLNDLTIQRVNAFRAKCQTIWPRIGMLSLHIDHLQNIEREMALTFYNMYKDSALIKYLSPMVIELSYYAIQLCCHRVSINFAITQWVTRCSDKGTVQEDHIKNVITSKVFLYIQSSGIWSKESIDLNPPHLKQTVEGIT